MANDAAWQAGVDIGLKRNKDQKPKTPKTKKPKSNGPTGSTLMAGTDRTTLQGALPGLIPSMKKGGAIKKTGIYRLHKGEYVMRAKHRSRKRGGQKKTVVKA